MSSESAPADPPGTTAESLGGDAGGGRVRPRWRTVLGAIVKYLIYILFLVLFTQFVRRVDWHQVADAIGQLTIWEVLVLLVLVALRQVCNATPLALLIPGLGIKRALSNDMSGFMVSVVAPNPADVFLRQRMLASWEIDTSVGIAGIIVNSLFYYVARFSAPIIGLLLYISFYDNSGAYTAAAVSGVVVVAVLLVGLVIAAKGERIAHAAGARAGRLARRAGADKIDPQAWGSSFADFQRAASNRIVRASTPSAAALILQLTTDATILAVSIRSVGITSSELSLVAIFAAFFCVYPITALPLVGLGVLDAALIALLADHDPGDTSRLVAALVVFRVMTLLVPLGLGAVALLHWRASSVIAPVSTDQPCTDQPSTDQPGAEGSGTDQSGPVVE
ncbi:uncharacterized membrane protein YbhN (UPF0104 family) [Jatrophihabitans sp. GAS493]|uniref:lysylphosphatidylglycerol synthase domain-containing protein n=1 Tax=Jatrophihabitans sp. GAS493 TaxID=1907575 RepID=UPI000BC0A121|nr:lysylphosphatidylglycerol synthase domain-containing protein [Jatrophihabitans sp. GAS493]SOD71496.1 uncharacterized membrane protein YbhN (UPF0104 family) [Jatrophihabitans sp. GAS493]